MTVAFTSFPAKSILVAPPPVPALSPETSSAAPPAVWRPGLRSRGRQASLLTQVEAGWCPRVAAQQQGRQGDAIWLVAWRHVHIHHVQVLSSGPVMRVCPASSPSSTS